VKEYFAQLPEYGVRCAQRLDLFLGIVAGVAFYLVAVACGLGRSVIVPVTIGIMVLGALEAGYGVYRQERIIRAEREAKIRLSASPGSQSWNYPDPGPDKVSLKTHVYWEIWADVDISTAKICLNIIGVRRKTWWQVWRLFKPREERLLGLPPKGQDDFTYRKSFRAIDPQPIRDDAEFEYHGPFDWDKDGYWRWELVLLTGSPDGRFSAEVDARLHERGSRKPL
jgi:hypothetical protein